MKFRKKPVEIEAIQWNGDNLYDVIMFANKSPKPMGFPDGISWDDYKDLVSREGLKIFTLEGSMLASVGDWVIRGVAGEIYPCKPDIFQKTYDVVSPQ